MVNLCWKSLASSEPVELMQILVMVIEYFILTFLGKNSAPVIVFLSLLTAAAHLF